VRWSSNTGASLDDYIVGKQVGQGAYATVRFGLHKDTGRKVAIKIYEKYKLLDPQRRKSVRREIKLMERMNHPNIVAFHDALDTSKQIYIVMEFAGGGSLHQYLKKRTARRLEETQAKKLFYQVCQAIKYCHDRHIVHRDVKLENILLDEQGTVKIIDFGFSTIIPPGKKLKIFCGTPSYMAPEIVARKEYSGMCADIWAMGVLLYALLCGCFPFKGQNDRDLSKDCQGRLLHPGLCFSDSEMLADAHPYGRHESATLRRRDHQRRMVHISPYGSICLEDVLAVPSQQFHLIERNHHRWRAHDRFVERWAECQRYRQRARVSPASV
jgi:serine/threonine protein kinase